MIFMDSPLRSFIEVPRDSHFPIQNLPFGIFQLKEGKPRVGVAIGEFVLDLSVLEELGHFRSSEFQEPALSASRTGRHVFSEDSLNTFLALGRPAWRKAREVIQHLLSAETPTLRDDAKLRARVFHAQKDVVMKLPARIGNYTDFYSSYHHAHNVGTMLRGPENALMPNWKRLPLFANRYHRRTPSRSRICPPQDGFAVVNEQRMISRSTLTLKRICKLHHWMLHILLHAQIFRIFTGALHSSLPITR